MNTEIEQMIIQYKKYTCDIIELLEKDNFDKLKETLKSRQNIINNIITMPDQKKEIKVIYDRLSIAEAENRALNIMKSKSAEIKVKLSNLSRNKDASNAYINFGNSPKIFSKKI